MPQEREQASRGVPKSENHDVQSFVTFINRTNVPVDIIWRDYQGRCVRYKNGLQPGARHHINTYVTHPWQAWEASTEKTMNIGGGQVYFPKPWQGEQTRTVVYIDRPLDSLLSICVQKVRSLVSIEDVEKLEIPRHLFDVIRFRRRTSVQEFQSRRRAQ